MRGALAVIVLFPPTMPASPPPPLGGKAPALRSAVEFRLPGTVASSEHVGVGVGPDGAPRRVTVDQKLHLTGTGDYSFVVPAPATSVGPGPDSQSQPGLRATGIVWQGFSSGERLLSSRATLRPGEAAAGLPLRVSVQRQGPSSVVRLSNATGRRVFVPTGRTTPAALDRTLARVRSAFRLPGGPGRLVSVPGETGPTTEVDAVAPLHVTGTIDGKPVDELLGGGALERSISVGSPAPKLDLRVEIPPPLEILPHEPGSLVDLQTALASVGVASSYRRYLASPDPSGLNDATYSYRSVPAAAAAARPRERGTSLLVVVLAALAGAGALYGLAVVWART